MKYLESVKETNETEFPEIEYIIRRYNILVAELEQSQIRQSTLNTEIESVQKSYQQFTKEQINNNLGLGTESAHLLKKLEKVETDLAQAENNLDVDMKNTSDRTSVISRILMAIENVYLRCRDESRVLKHYESLSIKSNAKDKDDIEFRKAEALARLEVIGGYIKDFGEICSGYEQFRKEEMKKGNAKSNSIAKAKPVIQTQKIEKKVGSTTEVTTHSVRGGIL